MSPYFSCQSFSLLVCLVLVSTSEILCFSVSLSQYVSLLEILLSVCLCLCVSLLLYILVSICLYLCVSLSVCLSGSVLVCLNISMFVFVALYHITLVCVC